MERLREQIVRFPSYSGLSLHLDQIEKYKETEPSLALDAAKSLLESLAKTMLADRNIVLNENDSIQSVIKKAVKTSQALASLSDNDSVQKIVNGMETASVGIGKLRNSFGLLSHGRDLHSKGIDKLSINLVIDTTLSIAHFLFALHEEERTTKQRIAYEDNPVFNRYFDSMYDEIEYIIAGVQISPSRALFHEDIEAYRIQLNGFKQLKAFLIRKLDKECDSDDLDDIMAFYDYYENDEKQIIREKYNSVVFQFDVPEELKQRFRSTFFPDENNEAETNSTSEDVQ